MTAFAYIDGGWALDALGQIRRAASAADVMRRILRPFFGAVVGEPWRGNTRRDVLKKVVDAAPVICADRARLLLRPLVRDGVIRDLSVSAAVAPANADFLRVTITATDVGGHPVRFEEFVRIA